MSIIDDLLILVEDSKKIDLDNTCAKMKGHRRQTISSSLGRLSAKGWINKVKSNKNYYYNITPEGRKTIDRELSNIKYLEPKDFPHAWQIIIFNIPEKNRKHRDELRRQLVSHGFGRLHDSIWFSKYDQKESISEIVNKLNIIDRIIFIETNKFTTAEEKKIKEKLHWDWKELYKRYKIFINKANKFLSNKNKERFQAKQLVYELVKIIKLDPKISNTINDINKKEAIKLYKKIKPYCY